MTSTSCAATRSVSKVPPGHYDIAVKSILIGDSGVGKSSLLYRYAEQDWNPHYIATIGVDFKILTFERHGQVVKLQLWDTAGQERFRTITRSYYRGAHSVMLVFDITNRESFDNVAGWMSDVSRLADQSRSVPMLLVGNKADCVKERVVPKEEAEALATSLGCAYMETSAKGNTEVDASFEYLVDQCVDHKLSSQRNRKTEAKEVTFGRHLRGVPITAASGRQDSVNGKCAC